MLHDDLRERGTALQEDVERRKPCDPLDLPCPPLAPGLDLAREDVLDAAETKPFGFMRFNPEYLGWSMAMRSCSMVSRLRTVTARSSRESKSTVTQYGVPISSCLR